jgi:hypothetical protein
MGLLAQSGLANSRRCPDVDRRQQLLCGRPSLATAGRNDWGCRSDPDCASTVGGLHCRVPAWISAMEKSLSLFILGCREAAAVGPCVGS